MADSDLPPAVAGVEYQTLPVAAPRDIGGRWRHLFVGLLVVLFAILLPITVTATWAHRTLLNTDQYVSTIGPIASDPAVTAALTTKVSNEIYDAIDVQTVISDALPPKAHFLAGPISGGVHDFISKTVGTVLASQAFHTIWTEANRFAHSQFIDIINGDSKAVTTSDGEVVLNLVPMVNEVLADIQTKASGLTGKPVKLPTISPTDPPAKACMKISDALHRPLPANCAQIALFPAKGLNSIRHIVKIFNAAAIALLVITPILFIAALLVSHRRRRTLLQLSIGGVIGLVIFRRVMIWLQNDVVHKAKASNKDAAKAIVTQVMHGFFYATGLILIVALIMIFLTLIFGPYRWAVAFRAWVVRVGQSIGHVSQVVVGKARDDATTTWIRGHLDLLRFIGVGIALLLLWLVSVSWVSLLIIVVLLILYEYGLYRIGHGPRPA
jgi:hypothetical protein